MQNIGFSYAILPGLKQLFPETYNTLIKKYTRFFNTQPYMAPTVIGVSLNLEEQGQGNMFEKIQTALSGSLAAIGDTFFWATLKPILALLCIISMLFDQIWCVVLVLLLFNSIHIWIMSWGFLKGYYLGAGGALSIGRLLNVDRSRSFSYITPFLCGIIFYITVNRIALPHGFPLGLGVLAASLIAIRLKLNTIIVFYGIFTLMLIWTMIL